jgi:hypothetical protein
MVDMKTYPVRKSLPTNYYTHIGRFVSRWAYLEWRMRRMTYALLDLGQKHGRVAVREPAVVDHLTMIEDLIFLDGLEVQTKLGPWKQPLAEIESYRNKMAHGIWVKRPDSKLPILQDTKGSHPQAIDPRPQARKARINPKAMAVTIDDLKGWTRATNSAVEMLEQLGAEIDRQRALRRKQQHQPEDTSAATRTIQAEEEPPSSSARAEMRPWPG